MKKIYVLISLVIFFSAGCSTKSKGKLYVEDSKWGHSSLYILNTSTKNIIEFSIQYDQVLNGRVRKGKISKKRVSPLEKKLVVVIDYTSVHNYKIIDAEIIKAE